MVTAKEMAPACQQDATNPKAEIDGASVSPAIVQADSSDCAHLQIRYSVFPTVGSQPAERCGTWRSLVKRLGQATVYPNKVACPLMSMVTFDGHGRKIENAQLAYGVVGDYDAGEIGIDQAADMLEAVGLEALLYTTASSTRTAPRWRVVVPLAAPVDVAEYPRMVARLNYALGAVLAPESFKPTQIFYYGAVRGVEACQRHCAGVPLDDSVLSLVLGEAFPEGGKSGPVDQAKAALSTPSVQGYALDDAREMLRNVSPEAMAGYEKWLNVGMALHFEFSGSDEAFELWDEFSCGWPNYHSTEYNREKWDSFNRTGGAMCSWTTLEALSGGRALTSEFPDLPPVDQGDAAPTPAKFQAVPWWEFADGPPPAWIVRDVLPEATLCVIYGASGSGKSFFVLDLVAAIARGVPWRDRKVKRGRVVYVAAEGAGSFRKRLTAYAQQYAVPPGDDHMPLRVVDRAPNLLVNDDKALAQVIEESGGASVVVIDTLAQSMPGGNENAPEGMGKAIDRCNQLHEATGALVVLIHHSGKDESRGARGWTGLRAAVDAEIEITRQGAFRQARITKQKDGDDEGLIFPFGLLQVEVGQDDDGQPVTSCVVDFDHVPQPTVQAKALGKWEQLVYAVVSEIGLSQNVGIEVDAVIAETLRQAPPPEEGKRDTRKQRVNRALKALCEGDNAPFFREGDTLTIL